MKKMIISLILCAASVVLAYGKPIEIKGFMAVGLWLVAIVFMILWAKKSAGAFRGAFISLLVCFLISSGLFFLRDHGSVTLQHTDTDGRTIIEYCDIDLGAMAKTRCRRTEYHSVLESRALTIRISKSVQLFYGGYWYRVG